MSLALRRSPQKRRQHQSSTPSIRLGGSSPVTLGRESRITPDPVEPSVIPPTALSLPRASKKPIGVWGAKMKPPAKIYRPGLRSTKGVIAGNDHRTRLVRGRRSHLRRCPRRRLAASRLVSASGCVSATSATPWLIAKDQYTPIITISVLVAANP